MISESIKQIVAIAGKQIGEYLLYPSVLLLYLEVIINWSGYILEYCRSDSSVLCYTFCQMGCGLFHSWLTQFLEDLVLDVLILSCGQPLPF